MQKCWRHTAVCNTALYKSWGKSKCGERSRSREGLEAKHATHSPVALPHVLLSGSHRVGSLREKRRRTGAGARVWRDIEWRKAHKDTEIKHPSTHTMTYVSPWIYLRLFCACASPSAWAAAVHAGWKGGGKWESIELKEKEECFPPSAFLLSSSG